MSESNGKAPLRLDIRTLKLRELGDIEAKVGHKIAAEIDSSDLSIDTLIGLAWIALRRERPEATFEEAAELDLGDILGSISGPEEMPPSQTAPLEPSGSSESPSGGTDSTARPPNGEPAVSSSTSTA